MQVLLERVDAAGLQLTRDDVTATVRTATNLRGALDLSAGVAARGVAADAVVLEALRLALEGLLIEAPSGGTITALALELASGTDGAVTADARADAVEAILRIAVGDLTLEGRARLQGVRLELRGQDGSLSAEGVVVEALAVRVSGTEVAVDSLTGTNVTIQWGNGGFRLTAGSLAAPGVRVATDGVAVTAKDLRLESLAYSEDDLRVASAVAASAHVEANLAGGAGSDRSAGASAPAPKTGRAGTAAPLVDLRLLDGLSGQLDVDVAVDLTVPIIGRRRATHELRVPIDRGTIDYLVLEHNLSTLEDAILDFSVRDGGLALERVRPLHPTRGHGKPVVRWPLGDEDLALAKNGRVRLSVLPGAQVAGSDEPPNSSGEASSSPVSLRFLRFLKIEARLALAPVEPPVATGQLRLSAVGSFLARGNLQYDPGDAAAPGAVHVEATDLTGSLHALPLGDRSLDVASATLAGPTQGDVAFADVTPTALRLELAGIALRDALLR